MKHIASNPFPFDSARGLIVNEKCSCGHNRTEHNDTIAFGHGQCAKIGCICNKFTWSEFTFADGKAAKHKAPAKCQCEHDIHFNPLDVRGNAHSYGAFNELQVVKTPCGTFHVCADCARTCLSIYPKAAR